jgi:hypothetical protein
MEHYVLFLKHPDRLFKACDVIEEVYGTEYSSLTVFEREEPDLVLVFFSEWANDTKLLTLQGTCSQSVSLASSFGMCERLFPSRMPSSGAFLNTCRNSSL